MLYTQTMFFFLKSSTCFWFSFPPRSALFIVMFGTLQVAPDRASSKNTLRINSQTLGSFRGGSLPNVSAGAPTVKTTPRSTESAKVTICCNWCTHPVAAHGDVFFCFRVSFFILFFCWQVARNV